MTLTECVLIAIFVIVGLGFGISFIYLDKIIDLLENLSIEVYLTQKEKEK